MKRKQKRHYFYLCLAILILQYSVLLPYSEYVPWGRINWITNETKVLFFNNSPNTETSAQKQLVLIDSIKELMQTSIEKIENDVEITATAFADARNIQRSMQWADIFGTVLDVAVGTIKTISSVLTFGNPSSSLRNEFLKYELPLQFFSGFLSIDSLRRDGDKLQLAIDGPGYYSMVKIMLEEAYKESSTKIYFNYEAYKATIKNHILGLYGSTPVFIPHKSSDVIRKNIEILKGAEKVQRAIRNRLRAVIERLENNQISYEHEKELTGLIEKIRKAILRSKLNDTSIKYKTFLKNETDITEVEQELWLGNIGELNKVRLNALTDFDKNIKREEILTISKAAGSMSAATSIFLKINYPGLKAGQVLAQISKIFMIPAGIDLSERMTRTSIYKTNPRDQINMIPQEMLLALSKEISDVWMIAEDMANYIEYLSTPKEIEDGKIYYIKSTYDFACEGDLWSMSLDGNEKAQLTFNEKIRDFKISPNQKKIAFEKMLHINELDKVFILDVDTLAKTEIKTENIKSYFQDYFWSPDGQNLRLLQWAKYPDDSHILKEYKFDKYNKAFCVFSIFFKLRHDISYVALSPDKKYIAYAEGTFVYLLNLENKNILKVAKCNEPFDHIIPEWHPMGQKILFDCGGFWKELGIEEGLHIFDVSNEKLSIINEKTYRSDPVWSPDGYKIVYCPGWWKNISIINANGTERRVLVYPPSPLRAIEAQNISYSGRVIDRVPYWNKDGTKIIFNRYYDIPKCSSDLGFLNPEIWIVDLDGRNLHRLTEKGCYLRHTYWGD